jgi:hypothetical protein
VAVDGEDPDDSSDPGLTGVPSRSMYIMMAVRNPTPAAPIAAATETDRSDA